MALAVILILYAGIGSLAAAGSVFLARKAFSARGEQIAFALFLVAIAGFYLAFTAHFGDEGAWRFEVGGVVAFAVLGLLGMRATAALVVGYFLHALWDVLHELSAHTELDLFGFAGQATEIPLAYGAFCLTYDWCLAAYFYTRRRDWRAARTAARR